MNNKYIGYYSLIQETTLDKAHKVIIDAHKVEDEHGLVFYEFSICIDQLLLADLEKLEDFGGDDADFTREGAVENISINNLCPYLSEKCVFTGDSFDEVVEDLYHYLLEMDYFDD